MKDELSGQIMNKSVELRVKTYSCFIDNDEDKKAKCTKKCVTKKNLNFKIIKTVQKQLKQRINKPFKKKEI